MDELLESIAQDSYGRLLAVLVKRYRDLELAEDALADAFREALEQWPSTGMPDRPESWLLTVAGRRMVDAIRRNTRGRELLTGVDWLPVELEPTEESFPDERMELILLCCHPELDKAIQIPLALQSVFRIPAHRLATGYAISDKAMSARLVRAKRKIRDGTLLFSLEEAALEERLPALLESLYLAFSLEGDILAASGENLRPEFLDLLRLLCDLTEPTAEMLGLQALFGFLTARDQARFGPSGEWIALSEQDSSKWNWTLMKQSDQALRRAHALGEPGRYQLEAAIESARAAGCRTGHPPWDSILKLYEGLHQIAPGIGCTVAWAAALLSGGKPVQALEKLTAIPQNAVKYYQPYFATLSAVYRTLDRSDEATAAARQAKELCTTERQRRFLDSRHPQL
jgi:predicted RNA polymerase sigma factor